MTAFTLKLLSESICAKIYQLPVPRGSSCDPRGEDADQISPVDCIGPVEHAKTREVQTRDGCDVSDAVTSRRVPSDHLDFFIQSQLRDEILGQLNGGIPIPGSWFAGQFCQSCMRL